VTLLRCVFEDLIFVDYDMVHEEQVYTCRFTHVCAAHHYLVLQKIHHLVPIQSGKVSRRIALLAPSHKSSPHAVMSAVKGSGRRPASSIEFLALTAAKPPEAPSSGLLTCIGSYWMVGDGLVYNPIVDISQPSLTSGSPEECTLPNKYIVAVWEEDDIPI
jgi:hypothetical protein